ncbi:MAG: metallophosphoesterase [Victivallales bacterium]|nr:metallophosphoesterase [Victivallales bacterium]
MKRLLGWLLFAMCLPMAFPADLDSIPSYPSEWTVFPCVETGYSPSLEELTEIPATLWGKSPVTVTVDETVDLAPVLGGVQEGATAWLYAELDAPAAMDYQVGAGADWWFAFYCNGEKAYSTLNAGNGFHPPQLSDHKFTLRLKPGRNVLAVKFVSGSASSILAMGGPRELTLGKAARLAQSRRASYEREVASVVPKDLPAVSPNLTRKFHFDTDGHFRVMQITDPQGAYPLEAPVKELIRQGIRKYRPDLIILTGDNTACYNKHGEFEQAAHEFMDIFVEEQVPHAITFGNHDSERKGADFYTRQEQYDIYKQMGGKYFVDFDIQELSGVGSGAIPLFSANGETPLFNLIVMDSGDYPPQGGYDGCRADQIQWYEEHAGALPCLWFQHIIVCEVNRTNVLVHVPSRPANIQLLETEDTTENDPEGFFSEPLNRWIKKLPEAAIWSKHLERYLIPEANMIWIEQRKMYLIQPTGTVWNDDVDSFDRLVEGIGTGKLKEKPCPPKWEIYTDALHTYQGRTLYQSWLKMGNLKGVYFGHDHMNTFDVTDQNGIRLGFCKAATLCSYNDGDPGFRLFDIHADGTYDTQIVTARQLGIIK